jgi:hypothetical protein
MSRGRGSHQDMNSASTLRVLSLVTTLSPSPKPSSSVLLAEQTLAEFAQLGCETELLRVVDHPVRFGVEKDWERATRGRRCGRRSWPRTSC